MPTIMVFSRGFAGDLDGQTRVMPVYVEEYQRQTQCQEIESMRSAVHSEEVCHLSKLLL